MTTMRAMQVSKAGGDFELVEREVPQPGPDEALIRVHACGVCHSDSFAKSGGWPTVRFPVVPGHEIAGVIEALGERVRGFQVGQRVGVGWFGGNCGWCEWCRRGSMIDCQNMEVPGISIDGGYADYVLVRAGAMARMPDELSAAEAAPLLCAGITTYNALRHSGAFGGQRVAVLGIGGLGHLGVQYAVKLGMETIAIARGADKEPLARELGAHHYVDSTAADPAEELNKLGGVDLILATATNADAMAAAFGALRPHGKLLIVGASMDPLPIPAAALLGPSLSIAGHASGTAQDSEDTLAFSVLTGVRPMIETMPLEAAGEAYQKMMDGHARFRMVITTGAS
ncbi:MAG TPA: alcohol dehydrogenase catalytic domain-containing protein [Solirubrobacteraceae bacterium]|jgi:D-arabinose 1-dehydrogenase-like Zn-dependent alcohol dehydrogenase|nr:alcohol dehydrogenase catalytic domain-containing protein [Solirubrobacteraceae bacterium]